MYAQINGNQVFYTIQGQGRHSKLAIFEQSGHFPFIEEPEKFVTVVREWLTSLG